MKTLVKIQLQLINLMFMKISPRNFLSVSLLGVSTFLSCLLTVGAFAEPIDYSEVSLLVRARETEPSIIQDVSSRKLVRPLTPQQETILKRQGASIPSSNLCAVPDLSLTAADASALETRREQNAKNHKATQATPVAADVRECGVAGWSTHLRSRSRLSGQFNPVGRA